MNRNITKQVRDNLRSAEMEKDTIYALFFTPKDAAENKGGFFDNPWCIHLIGNPEGKPEYIAAAIKTFEAKHQVKSWLEIAVSYKSDSLYYP